VIELWLACKTHGEIADIIGLSRSRTTEIVGNFRNENIDILSQNPPESRELLHDVTIG
jgi:transcription antitermination factor NusA-like protein